MSKKALPEHFRLSPSSAYRWIQCPGSAQEGLPDRETDAARLGTLAHAVACAELTGTEVDKGFREELEAMEYDEEQEELYGELVLGVQLYVEFVKTLEGELHHELKLYSEIVEDFGGTTDTLALTPDVMHVADFKFGTHFVPITKNTQILSYLCLAREKFGPRKHYFGTIIQPRVNERVETAAFTDADLDKHLVDVIDASEDTTLIAGSHCTYCPLLLNCKTAYDWNCRMANLEFEEIVDHDGDDIPRLLEILEWEDVAKTISRLAKDKLLELAMNGVEVPGYKAAQGLKNRSWLNEGQALERLKKRWPKLGAKFVKTTLRTPAQIEKLVPKTELAKLELYHRPKGPICLVPESSSLEEVATSGEEFDEVGD